MVSLYSKFRQKKLKLIGYVVIFQVFQILTEHQFPHIKIIFAPTRELFNKTTMLGPNNEPLNN